MNIIILTILKTVGSFILLWAGLRILGKKQLGELSIYNVATITAVGQMAADLTTQYEEHIITHIIGILGYFFLSYLIGYLSLKSVPVREFFEGTPAVVIANGKILEKQLKHTGMSIDNMMEKLREQQVFNIADVEFAIMEPGGKMSVMLKPPYRLLTWESLNQGVKYEGLPTDIIKDGKLLDDALVKLGLTRDWVKVQLESRHIKDVSEIFLAQLDTSGRLYVDLKQERVKSPD